jgi:hypothetical protein
VKEVLAGLGEDLANPLLSDLGDWTVKRVVDSMCGYLGFQAWTAPSSSELPHLCADHVAVVVRDCLAQSEPPVSAQGERELQLNRTSKELPPQVMESVISSEASSHQPPQPAAAHYSPLTSIETWLGDVNLSRYIPYFRDILGAVTLEDILPFAKESMTKEQLIEEWKDFDFKSSVSLLHQTVIVRELRNLAITMK